MHVSTFRDVWSVDVRVRVHPKDARLGVRSQAACHGRQADGMITAQRQAETILGQDRRYGRRKLQECYRSYSRSRERIGRLHSYLLCVFDVVQRVHEVGWHVLVAIDGLLFHVAVIKITIVFDIVTWNKHFNLILICMYVCMLSLIHI